MPRGVRLKIVIGRVQRLPDSIQARVPVDRARRAISLILSLGLGYDWRDDSWRKDSYRSDSQQRQDSQGLLSRE
jgi:hypothetical protein